MDDINWKEPFRAQDFTGVDMSEPKPTCRFGLTDYQAERIAGAANARFRELVKGAPVVFAQTYEDGTSIYGWRDVQKIHCTHTARLIDISPIGEGDGNG